MDGAFRGDFTRDTFYAFNHYSRVLKQQGRVDLEAEWNEQVDILIYYLRMLIRDLIGPYGVPSEDDFSIQSSDGQSGKSTAQSKPGKGAKGKLPAPDFYIHPGHYYVDGILAESDRPHPYPYTIDPNQQQKDVTYLVYLDVWEEQITCLEDNRIREVALGVLGPDTTTRAKVVWQVRFTKNKPDDTPIPSPPGTEDISDLDENWDTWVKTWQPPKPYRGLLKAKTRDDDQKDTSPCITPPDSRFRGAENQLYRVEIHDGGQAGQATFKWSRENGSVVFPIGKLAGQVVTLDHLGRDKRFGLKKDDWVEIVDDDSIPRDSPHPLLQVDNVDYIHMVVTLKEAPHDDVGQDPSKHPFLRRWEHYHGDPRNEEDPTPGEGVTVIEEKKWYTLEDGIQIQFESKEQQPKSQARSKSQVQSTNGSKSVEQSATTHITYRPGDYWLIPARTVTGDIEWPHNGQGEPEAIPPHGVEHHYAPLAFVTFDQNGKVEDGGIQNLRRHFTQLAALVPVKTSVVQPAPA